MTMPGTEVPNETFGDLIREVKGFLAEEEGRTLYELALAQSRLGPCLEIGSYCGLSTLYLGLGVRKNRGVLFAVDHHQGSEEHQPGEEYHDSELMDPCTGALNSFPEFQKTIRRAGLEDTVVPIVASSALTARHWATPLALVFIDGGHSPAAALSDYRAWAPQLMPGGVLAVHDLFPDPSQGGQAPYTIYSMALASGLFEEIQQVNTLGILKRL